MSKTVTSEIQVLTLDYLIEGSVNLDDEITSIFEGGESYYENRYNINISPAKVYSVGGQKQEIITVSKWTLSQRSGLIAIIPLDETSTKALLRDINIKKFTDEVVMYTGSFIITALVIPDSLFEDWVFVHAKDAKIECNLPETKFKSIYSPWILINNELLQGYHPK
jgi:hypothetical protein